MAIKIFTPEEIKAENGLKIGKSIFEHTLVIFYINEKGKPQPAASAICLKYEEDHFIVTASHALRNLEGYRVGMIPEANWKPLDGEYVMSDYPKINDDKFDIAIVKLDRESVEKITPSYLRFFDLKGFRPDHDDEEGQTYLLVGHPVTKTKLNHAKGKKHLAPLIYLSDLNLQESLFIRQGFRPLTHQLLNYRPRRIFDLNETPVQGPKPVGLSGCGIWKLSDLITDSHQSIRFFPTSMVIEFDDNYSVLAATRINVITEMIRREFNISLPASSYLEIPPGMMHS
jgi:hypothetical protein